MFLRDNKWMKTWSQFVPSCVIFACLGFLFGLLSNLIPSHWTRWAFTQSGMGLLVTGNFSHKCTLSSSQLVAINIMAFLTRWTQ